MCAERSALLHPEAAGQRPAPIGVFDSGYGGLTVLRELIDALPQYDYLYLGDNARTPYGTRSFETVYQYTLEAVRWFARQGCALVILACNTASAKALRSIQQNDLPHIARLRRVLGVLRPSTESIGQYSHSGSIGILATRGTVASSSYPTEIAHFFPQLKVYQQACPMWVPIVENNEIDTPGADYFVADRIRALFAQSAQIDTVLLACTHYPLLRKQIAAHLPEGVRLVSQGKLVATSLVDYLQRHPEIDCLLSRNGARSFCTTDSTRDFDAHSALFFGEAVHSQQVSL